MAEGVTRRRLLAGAGAAVGGGALAGWVAPTWLPDPVTDALILAYPDVPSQLWRPSVSSAHADEAVAELEATVERARALQERIDVDSLPEDLAFHLDNEDPSGGWLESAKDESDPSERLFAATYGMQFAGEVVGYARVVLDEEDPEALAERADRIREAAEDVLASFSEYRVSDPGRDLAPLYFVERELSLARIDTGREWREDGEPIGEGEYSARDVASAWGSHTQAEQRLRNARHYREQYRENLGDDARPYADTLEQAQSAFADAVESFPTREELRTELSEERDLTQETPYGAARWELFTLCYDNDFRFGFESDGYRSGHRLQQVVETGLALLARRSHEFALAELGVEPDDTDYDSGHAFRAKRRAVRTFGSVRDEHGSPFAGVVAESATDLIRAGDIGLGDWDRPGDRPAWQARVEAATYYLVGTGVLRELGDVLAPVFGEID